VSRRGGRRGGEVTGAGAVSRASAAASREVTEAMGEARSLLMSGDLAGARRRVEDAAALWRGAANAAEEARCLALAASLARHQGRTAEAATLAARAVVCAPGGSATAALAREETVTTALAARDQAAVPAAEAALRDAVPASDRSALERGYASALLAAGRGGDALAALDRAASALAEDPAAAAGCLVDGVAQLQAAGRDDLAERLAATEAGDAAAADHAAASDLALLAAARALDRKDLRGALAHARRARAEALLGRSATGYVAAAIALAELAEASGDRAAAYASLAVGWVTLRDLVGWELARAAFEPRLLVLRQRWGAAAFAAVKTAYEEARRGA
jgi:hypothetical protein